MHLQPQAEAYDKAGSSSKCLLKPTRALVHLICPLLSLYKSIIFIEHLVCSRQPNSALVARHRFVDVFVMCNCHIDRHQYLISFLQLLPYTPYSSRGSVVDFHGRRRNGTLAVICGKAHAGFCFFNRVWFFLQGLYSAQRQHVLIFPPQLPLYTYLRLCTLPFW